MLRLSIFFSFFFFFEALNLDAVHQEPLVLPPHKNKNKTVTLFSLAARSSRQSAERARVALSPVKNSILKRGSSPKTEGPPLRLEERQLATFSDLQQRRREASLWQNHSGDVSA